MSKPWRQAPPALVLGPLDRALKRASRRLRHLGPATADRLAGGSRHNQRGTQLDPHLNLILRLEKAAGKSLAVGDIADARRGMRRSIHLVDGPPVPVFDVQNRVLHSGCPVRIYRPSAAPAPLLVYFHGGGWVLGDLETHDRFCRRLCAEGGLVVAAVDYPLAPEHPFPAAIEEAQTSFVELAGMAATLGADPTRIGMGGDSAGGNLATVLCRQLRDRRRAGEDLPQIALQLLIYPATDFRRIEASHQEFAAGFMLTGEAIDFYKATYAAPDDSDPDVSPLLCADLRDLPPALLVTAGFDPLRDEGEAYGQRLRAADVPVQHQDCAGLLHGFVHLDSASPACDRAVAALIAETARLLRA